MSGVYPSIRMKRWPTMIARRSGPCIVPGHCAPFREVRNLPERAKVSRWLGCRPWRRPCRVGTGAGKCLSGGSRGVGKKLPRQVRRRAVDCARPRPALARRRGVTKRGVSFRAPSGRVSHPGLAGQSPVWNRNEHVPWRGRAKDRRVSLLLLTTHSRPSQAAVQRPPIGCSQLDRRLASPRAGLHKP